MITGSVFSQEIVDKRTAEEGFLGNEFPTDNSAKPSLPLLTNISTEFLSFLTLQMISSHANGTCSHEIHESLHRLGIWFPSAMQGFSPQNFSHRLIFPSVLDLVFHPSRFSAFATILD